jgi:hypothetical protein
MKKESSVRSGASIRIFTAVVLITALVTLARCGKSPTTAATTTPGTFTDIYTNTLSTACIQCHVPGGSAAADGVTLDFSTQANAYTTLTTGLVEDGSTKPKCPNVKLVTSGNPTGSYLLAVLVSNFYTGTSFDGVSGCTPNTAHIQLTAINASEQSSITTWIQGGLLNN